MPGGKRAGAGRPRSAPHIEGWKGCRCADCRTRQGGAGGEIKPESPADIGPKSPSDLGRHGVKREKAVKVVFGRVADPEYRSDVVKDGGSEPGETGGL